MTTSRQPPLRKGPQPLAALLDACLAPALRKQGFVSNDVVMRWGEIVGARLAARSRPLQIKWPRGDHSGGEGAARHGAEGATLLVQVEGAFALEFEYSRAMVSERINTHFGWRAIGKVVIRQGPVTVAMPTVKARPQPTPLERAGVADCVGPVEGPLGEALRRLGERVAVAGRR